MLPLFVATALAAPLPCGTPAFLPLRDGPLGVAPDRAPPAAKAERDAWGTYPHVAASTNFVVKWGDGGAVSQEEVDALLDAFEEGWAVEIGEMGHPAPLGTDTWLFNVYVGDTGDGTPSSNGAGGYYWRDDDGMPYVVVARDSLYYPDYAQGTAVHELYHALQDAVGTYGYGDGNVGAWYWEATAGWAQGEVYPENATYAQFLMGYAWLPELPVGFFDYPDSGALEEYHQYGAFIFPRYVSEVAADRDLVVQSWLDAGGEEDPVAVLAAGLEARGVAFADAFGDFAARNAGWDYADGDVYADSLMAWSGYFDDNAASADNVGEEGTGGWLDLPEGHAPQRHGYAVVRAHLGAYGARIDVGGDPVGSRESPSAWRVTVVEVDDDVMTYHPVTLDGEGEGSVVLRGDGEAWIVAAAVPDRAESGETFGFAYGVEPGEPPDTEAPEGGKGEEPAACGCAVGGAAGGAVGRGGAGARGAVAAVLAGVAAAAAVARRRR